MVFFATMFAGVPIDLAFVARAGRRRDAGLLSGSAAKTRSSRPSPFRSAASPDMPLPSRPLKVVGFTSNVPSPRHEEHRAGRLDVRSGSSTTRSSQPSLLKSPKMASA